VTRLRRAVAVGALLLVAVAPLASAGDAPRFVPYGTKVRVTLCSPAPIPVSRGAAAPRTRLVRERIVGTLVRVERETLVVNDRKERLDFAIPIASVGTLDVSHGRRTRAGKGALIGLGTGAAAGVATALIVCADGECSGSGIGDVTGWVAGAFGIGGALAGLGVGALVGGRIHPERWERVPLGDLRLGLAPTRGRGACLSLSFALP
jgi:hypothetical protein